MPLRGACGDCCKVLYEGPDVKSPFEVTVGYDGRCPGCKKRLEKSARRIDVKMANSADCTR